MTWFKEILGRPAGHIPIGPFLKIPSIEVVEIIKMAGFDFVVFDAEHAMLSVSDLNVLVAMARALDLPPLVRVPNHDYGDMQRILDAGAAGILWPHVSNAEECRAVVRQASHPPLGTRGSGGGMRAGGWGISRDPDVNYLRDGRERVMKIPMIEEIGAVENAETILSVEGVDAVFIGPGDLSLTMGKKPTDPDVVAAVDRTFTIAKEKGVRVATLARGAADARAKAEQGYDFLMVGNDTGLLARAARALVDEIRG
ncbi:HpcH/HpaI aldolase family protein [Amycolatopsis pigmentata]|uniref:HpcH/HpaI aldolase/citrate lyase family protein n=1 Tax=Amycolatopsis pigmentata TaxID=450801 RepID=A0ABW5FKG4_9PSEU